MLKKKNMYVAGLLCVSLMGYSVQANTIESGSMTENTQVEADAENEEDTSQIIEEEENEQTIENIGGLIQQMLEMNKERYNTFAVQEEVMTQREFARILCYRLKLSPVYSQVPDEDPYVVCLKKEGIWNDAIPENITLLDRQIIESCLEKVNAYNEKGVGTPFYSAAPIGFVQKGTMKMQLDSRVYPLYYLSDVNYIRLSDLKQMGFETIQQQGYLALNLNTEKEVLPKAPESKTLTHQVAMMHTEKIYIGNVLSYALKCGEDILIPLRSISEYYDLVIEGSMCTLKEKYNISTHYIDLAPGSLHNVSDEVIDVQVVSVFWDGRQLIEEALYIEKLMPDEYYPLNEGLYALDNKVTHVSTMLAGIQTEGMTMNAPYKSYGQHTQSLLKNYSAHQNESLDVYMSKLFPKSKIIGTMKYESKGLKKGEKVEVWAAEDGYCYYILKDGKKIEVPWSSVSIPPNPPVCKEQVPKEMIEGYVNSKQVKSKTPYFIWTDLYRQTTYVFENKGGSWSLIRSMPTSTGNNKTPTPTGEFEVQAYVPAFGMDKGYRCKNALHLFGDYLYHSVMFDIEGRYVIGGQGQLGQRASHGCLRLSVENSEWLYNTMPLGTKVWIR